jgi:hypothetical protein
MKYILIYRRYYVTYSEEFESLETAISFLEAAEDEGYIMPVAVIYDGKMVWYKKFLGKKTCLERVSEFNQTNK